jgi:hypothetical protein
LTGRSQLALQITNRTLQLGETLLVFGGEFVQFPAQFGLPPQ